jgi:hypothetical protein
LLGCLVRVRQFQLRSVRLLPVTSLKATQRFRRS